MATVPGDVMVVGRNGTRGGYARTFDGGVFWLLSQFRSPELAGTKKEQCLLRARDLDDGDWNPLLAELVRATPEELILHNKIMVVPPSPRWTSGRVALVGDAAHAMSPHITAGVSLGVEDAALLARCLSATDDIAGALTRYADDRIPHHEHVAQLSAAVETSASACSAVSRRNANRRWCVHSSPVATPSR